MRAFMSRLVGNSEDPHRTEDVVYVKHGKDEHIFKFPLKAISSGTLTVGAVRAKCSQVTRVEPNRISLVWSGKNLKEDTSTLASLGIPSGAKILCMASQQKANHVAAKTGPITPAAPKILTPLEKIEAVREAVKTQTSEMTREFLSNPPGDKNQREDAHRVITETIMAHLLKLDSVESDEPQIKSKRKEVVREIQQTLLALDEKLKEQASL